MDMTIYFIIVMVFLGLLVVLVSMMNGPHRYFRAPPPELGPDDPPWPEEDPAPAPDLDPAAKRKKFRKLGGEVMNEKLFGKGIDFTGREKKFIVKLFENCKDYWDRDNCEWFYVDGYKQGCWRPRPPDVGEFFTVITGISKMTGHRFKEEVGKDDAKHGPAGMVMPTQLRTGAKRTEVNKQALEVSLPDLDLFIRDEIVKARKGGHLTVEILTAKANDYFRGDGIRIKEQRMRRALRRLGYEYKKREGKYVNRRHEAKNLKKLKEYCEWVAENVQWDAAAKLYKFKVPVGFGDGANEYTKSFRALSWMLSKDPVLSTCEKPKDENRQPGQRLNMLGAVYGHSFDMNSFEAWNSDEAGRNAYAKSSDIVRHTANHVVPNLPRGTGAVYVLDNASNNKKIDETLRAATNDELHDWINQHDPDPARFQKYWEDEVANETAAGKEKKLMFRYIRTHVDEFTEIAQLLRTHDIKLKYLPAYYPECNPIELIWAQIKKAYKKTDSSLPWRQRLDEAHAEVKEEQIDKAFDHCIRYCLDRLVELREKGQVHEDVGEDTAVIYDEGDDSEDEWVNMA